MDISDKDPGRDSTSLSPSYPSISKTNDDENEDVQLLKIRTQIRRLHQKRGTLSTFQRSALHDNPLVDYCRSIASPFESGLFIFANDEDKSFLVKQIAEQPETLKLRWNWTDLYAEFRMPESFAHAEADVELAQIIIETIIITYFVPGTTRYASGLRNAASASRYLGTAEKSPDMSIGFQGFESTTFIIGETGYSDSGSLTRRRVQEWLIQSHGDIRVGLSLDIRTKWDANLNRIILDDVVLDVYHMMVDSNRKTEGQGGTHICVPAASLSLKNINQRTVTLPTVDIFPPGLPCQHLPLLQPTPPTVTFDFSTVYFIIDECLATWNRG